MYCTLVIHDWSNLCWIIPFVLFFRYFIRTWTRSYTIDDWVVGDERARTNNAVESTNNQMKANMSVRPSVWQFMTDLHQHVERTIISFSVDTRNGYTRRECRSLDKELRKAREKLATEEFDVREFLDHMANIWIVQK